MTLRMLPDLLKTQSIKVGFLILLLGSVGKNRKTMYEGAAMR